MSLSLKKKNEHCIAEIQYNQNEYIYVAELDIADAWFGAKWKWVNFIWGNVFF